MTEAGSAGRDFWFMDTQIAIPVSYRDGTDRISVIDHRSHYGDSPPLHLHRNQDEIFHILEGKLRFVVDGKELHAGAGETFIAAKGTRHTYRVESQEGARWLIVTLGGDFEDFVRALSRPAERDGLPDPSGPPTPDQVQALASVAAQHGIEIVGPPLT